VRQDLAIGKLRSRIGRIRPKSLVSQVWLASLPAPKSKIRYRNCGPEAHHPLGYHMSEFGAAANLIFGDVRVGRTTAATTAELERGGRVDSEAAR